VLKMGKLIAATNPTVTPETVAQYVYGKVLNI
jgi:hypothetical protein